MKDYIILTTNFGITTETTKSAESLNKLIEFINKTKRAKMEYQIYSGRPFTFETLLYSNNNI